MYLRFLMMLELHYILVGLNYQWKQRYNYVLFLFVIAMYFFITLQFSYSFVRCSYVFS